MKSDHEVTRLLESPESSEWLRSALMMAMSCDVAAAAADAETLAHVLHKNMMDCLQIRDEDIRAILHDKEASGWIVAAIKQAVQWGAVETHRDAVKMATALRHRADEVGHGNPREPTDTQTAPAALRFAKAK